MAKTITKEPAKATAVVEIAEDRPFSSSLRDVEQQIYYQDPEVHMETQLSVLRSRQRGTSKPLRFTIGTPSTSGTG